MDRSPTSRISTSLLLGLCLAALATAGCAGGDRVVRTVDVEARMQEAMGGGVWRPPRALRVRPARDGDGFAWPVRLPARTLKVWVPAHVNGGDHDKAVLGHWAVLVVERERFALPGPPTSLRRRTGLVPWVRGAGIAGQIERLLKGRGEGGGRR
jgi:hypothetical protein